MLVLLLLAVVPYEHELVDHCDEIEINHIFDPDTGTVKATQLIFRDCGEIRDWRWVKDAGRPRKNWQTGYWDAVWLEKDIMRTVRARACTETWSDHDREVIERDWLPEDRRRRLRQGCNGELP